MAVVDGQIQTFSSGELPQTALAGDALPVQVERSLWIDDGTVSRPIELRIETDDREILQIFDPSDGMVMQNSRLIGGQDSKHHVFALDIVPASASDEVRTIVVKPQDSRPQRADVEFSMLKAVAEMGFPAIRPLGIATEPHSSTRFLLTEYMPNVHVYTELPWRDGYLGTATNTEQLQPALTDAAGFMARLHLAGFTHGDAQLKNIAQQRNGEFVVLDVENGQVHAQRDEEWSKDVAKDFKSFISSLWHVGYLQLSSPETFSSEVSKAFYDAYVETCESDPLFDEAQAEVIMNAFDAALRHATQIPRTVKVAA